MPRTEKKTIVVYKNGKKEIRNENLYDNKEGNTLPFVTRAGRKRKKT